MMPCKCFVVQEIIALFVALEHQTYPSICLSFMAIMNSNTFNKILKFINNIAHVAEAV